MYATLHTPQTLHTENTSQHIQPKIHASGLFTVLSPLWEPLASIFGSLPLPWAPARVSVTPSPTPDASQLPPPFPRREDNVCLCCLRYTDIFFLLTAFLFV